MEDKQEKNKLIISNKQLQFALAIAGIGVSLYLTYIKLGANPYICSFGDCGTVQTSDYASILGIPVALLGVVFYLIFFGLVHLNKIELTMYWLVWGVIFSLYLTYLELFVIEAICGWCVVSAIIILLATGIQSHTYRKFKKENLE